MKRILIIALASIFIVNMLALISKAAEMSINPEATEQTASEENYFVRWNTLKYNFDKTKKYKITVTIPETQVNQYKETLLKITIPVTLTNTSTYSIRYPQTTVAGNMENVDFESVKLNGRTYDIVLSFKKYYGGNPVAIKTVSIEYYSNEVGQTFTLQELPKVTIQQYTPTIEEILINNVTNAPKDVLREVVAVLPVLIGILIAYIATRKGIAFIRSILESA